MNFSLLCTETNLNDLEIYISLIYLYTHSHISKVCIAQPLYQTKRHFLCGVQLLLNQFTFFHIGCPTKTEDTSLFYCLPIVRHETIFSFPFSEAQIKMQIASFRNWTWSIKFISNDNDYYNSWNRFSCTVDFLRFKLYCWFPTF